MPRRGASATASIGISLAIGAAVILSFLTPPDPLVVVSALGPALQIPAMDKTTPIALPPPPPAMQAPVPPVVYEGRVVAEVLAPEVETPQVRRLQPADPAATPATVPVTPMVPEPPQQVAEIDPLPLTPMPFEDATPTNDGPANDPPAISEPLELLELLELPLADESPLPDQDPATRPAPVVIEITALSEGRPLLRILEHGAGPSIEIAWPNAPNDRERLFQVFQSCFGMQVAVMDAQGNVFRDAGQSGQRWDIDLDRFSGFVRQTMGELTAAETAVVRATTTRHRGINGPTAIRIFPRNADALLLGGLQQMVGGGNYGNIGTIHAEYRLEGSAVIVDRIVADGRSIPGNIPMSAASRC
jgi:hypothetical protein